MISLRTLECSGGSLKTRLVEWCSHSGESTPDLGANSMCLSDLGTAASLPRHQFGIAVGKSEPSGMRRAGSCSRSSAQTGNGLARKLAGRSHRTNVVAISQARSAFKGRVIVSGPTTVFRF